MKFIVRIIIFIFTNLLFVNNCSNADILSEKDFSLKKDRTYYDAHPPVPVKRKIVSLPSKSLHLKAINTGEEVDAIFWKDGAYVPKGMAKLNRLLRDHRNGDIKPIDPELFMLIHRLYDDLNATGVIEVISGHRSKKTNDMLRSIGRKVAKKSQHVQGKAIDIRIPSVPLKKLRDKALSYGVGGVGYYRKSNFVHIDTGRPRFW